MHSDAYYQERGMQIQREQQAIVMEAEEWTEVPTQGEVSTGDKMMRWLDDTYGVREPALIAYIDQMVSVCNRRNSSISLLNLVLFGIAMERCRQHQNGGNGN